MEYKTIFLGTAPFGLPVLRAMEQDDRLDVKGVFTQPDRRQGRGQETQSPPVADCARELELPLFQPEDINETGPERIQELGEIDFGIVIAYGQILSEEFLKETDRGFFNFHASLLPRWRGAAPIRHSLLKGDEETGVTVFKIVPDLDAGPIGVTLKLPIKADETYGTLYDRLSEVNVGALRLFLSDLGENRLSFEEQDGSVSYASRIRSEDARIDWTDSAEDLELFVRAFNPSPGAFTVLNGQRFKIYRMSVNRNSPESEAGQIVSVTNDELRVATGTESISLKEVQPAGSRRMTIKEYLAGNPDITAGDRFESDPSSSD